MKEVEFRDGKKLVLDHLAEMMTDLPTHTMTYEQAVEKANWKLSQDHIGKAFDSIVQGHFRNQGGGS